MSDPLLQIVLTFVASALTVLLVQRVQAQAEYKRAEAEHDRAEADIGSVSIGTALQLLDRVKKENLDLSARAASLEGLANDLSREVKKLREDLAAVQDGAKRLYYQVKGLSAAAVPVYTPSGVTGPLEKKAAE